MGDRRAFGRANTDGPYGGPEVPGALVVNVGDIAPGTVDFEAGGPLAPRDVDHAGAVPAHIEMAVGVIIHAAVHEAHAGHHRLRGLRVQQFGQIEAVHSDVHHHTAARHGRLEPP